ncbi:hypothetical protein MBT84_45845 [Streptomyces sp. MBT84]|nr:hypothetical protein [Streptomyces sp. MBT84]
MVATWELVSAAAFQTCTSARLPRKKEARTSLERALPRVNLPVKPETAVWEPRATGRSSTYSVIALLVGS